jgi:hypothetical protein
MPKLDKFDRKHLANLTAYEREIDRLFQEAVTQAAMIGSSISDLSPDVLFSFDNDPVLRKKFERLMSGLKKGMSAAVVNGINSEWTLANNKNNELSNFVFGDSVGNLSQAQYSRYYNNNDEARKAFIARKENGLALSDRVWNYTDQFKEEIELGLDVGIRNGSSAAEMSRELQSYLKYPDKLFRRVRDKHGVLQLSKAAKAFHPGQGVYRSSYKNARRLAATEGNIAYHTANYLRWQQLPFVVGIEVITSNNHPVPDICDDLKGCYPKDFKFTGWHPQCRCSALTIIKTDDEINADLDKIERGESLDSESVNSVADVPQGFRDWIADNEKRIEQSRSRGTLPYFLRFNGKFLSKSQPDIVDVVVPKAKPVDDMVAMFDRMRKHYGAIANIDGDFYISQCLPNFNFEEYIQEIESNFNSHGASLSRFVISADRESQVSLYTFGQYKEESFYIHRIFKRENDELAVIHNYFKLPEAIQGKGISKEAFRSMYKQYEAAGVDKIYVHANKNVGGYCWGEYGFYADKSQAWGIAIRDESNPVSKLMKENINKFYSKHSDSDLFPMRWLSKIDGAKEYMLGSSWFGELNLKDKKGINDFITYLFGKKK